jgi:hypothetical protein
MQDDERGSPSTTTQYLLGVEWSALLTGDRAANLQRGIMHYESALRVFTEASHPVNWATTQRGLGVAWYSLCVRRRGETRWS